MRLKIEQMKNSVLVKRRMATLPPSREGGGPRKIYGVSVALSVGDDDVGCHRVPPSPMSIVPWESGWVVPVSAGQFVLLLSGVF